MNKSEFIDSLRNRLNGLSQEDIESSLEFYAEAIEDRVESGLTEEEAVAELGSVEEVSRQILTDVSLPKLIKARVAAKRTSSARWVIPIVLGAPLWIPLLSAAAICVLACYVVVWTVVLSLYAVDFALAVSVAAGLVGMVRALLQGNIIAACFALGLGLVSAGLSMMLFVSLGRITKMGINLSGKLLLRVKSLLIRKDNAK